MSREASDDSAGSVEIHEAPDLAIPLRAGPLRLVFDRGELRWIRLGEIEVLRGIYVALREAGWARVPGSIEDLVVEAEPESFRIRFVSRHRRGTVAFDWQARIEGRADGRIRFSLDGAAGSTFLHNRVGFCVLHPIDRCAGRPCTIETTGGRRTPAVFPHLVSPHQPMTDLRALTHEALPGLFVEVRLEGDAFEMEDQRNWSDCSFKTYAPPLGPPLPVEMREGTRILQTVSLQLSGDAGDAVREAVAVVPGALPRRRNGTESVLVTVEPSPAAVRPRVGLGGAGLVTLADSEARRLRQLGLDHVRADLHLEAEGWEAAIERATANARLLGLPLELALFLPGAADGPLAQLGERSRSLRPSVARWQVFASADGTTREGQASAARRALGAVDPGALFVGGTDRHFVELNRQRPPTADLDGLSFALTPQAHAFDDATLVESLETLAWLIETARSFAPGLPLAISPVTLRPRSDPRPPASREPGRPPFTDDPRQAEPFAAAWVLGFVAAASAAGFASLTLFELVGPRGVLDGERLYPVWHALAELELAGVTGVEAARSQRPERVQALALRHGERLRLFLANVSAATQPVRVLGLRSGRVTAGGLGESGEDVPGPPAELAFELAPHEILRLDAAAPGR